MKIFLWLLFIALVLLMGHDAYVIQFRASAGSDYALTWLEFVGPSEGKAILQCWRSVPYGDGSLLDVACSNTHTDFLFLLTYSMLLLIYSNSQMQRERLPVLNALLRLNLFLAVLTGLLDITENVILLYDMRHVADPNIYISSQAVSIPKWCSAGWAVLVWLVSVIHSATTGKERSDILSGQPATI